MKDVLYRSMRSEARCYIAQELRAANRIPFDDARLPTIYLIRVLREAANSEQVSHQTTVRVQCHGYGVTPTRAYVKDKTVHHTREKWRELRQRKYAHHTLVPYIYPAARLFFGCESKTTASDDGHAERSERKQLAKEARYRTRTVELYPCSHPSN